jgi:hypothetical protein
MNKAEAVSRVENGEVRVTEWRFSPGAETDGIATNMIMSSFP